MWKPSQLETSVRCSGLNVTIESWTWKYSEVERKGCQAAWKCNFTHFLTALLAQNYYYIILHNILFIHTIFHLVFIQWHRATQDQHFTFPCILCKNEKKEREVNAAQICGFDFFFFFNEQGFRLTEIKKGENKGLYSAGKNWLMEIVKWDNKRRMGHCGGSQQPQYRTKINRVG